MLKEPTRAVVHTIPKKSPVSTFWLDDQQINCKLVNIRPKKMSSTPWGQVYKWCIHLVVFQPILMKFSTRRFEWCGQIWPNTTAVLEVSCTRPDLWKLAKNNQMDPSFVYLAPRCGWHIKMHALKRISSRLLEVKVQVF